MLAPTLCTARYPECGPLLTPVTGARRRREGYLPIPSIRKCARLSATRRHVRCQSCLVMCVAASQSCMHCLKYSSLSCRISAGVILALGLVSADGGDCSFVGFSEAGDGVSPEGVAAARGVAVSGTASGSATAVAARTNRVRSREATRASGPHPFRFRMPERHPRRTGFQLGQLPGFLALIPIGGGRPRRRPSVAAAFAVPRPLSQC